MSTSTRKSKILQMQPPAPEIPTKQQVEALIYWRAPQHGLDPALLTRQCQAESNYDQRAKSHCGALGLFQLMPATAQELGVDPLDWKQNVEGALRYMRQLVTRYHGDYAKALAAYNWGMGNLEKKAIAVYGEAWRDHLPAETTNYLRKILEPLPPAA